MPTFKASFEGVVAQLIPATDARRLRETA